MFTGIITDIGEVASVSETDGGRRLVIRTSLDISATAIGASICCSGACMTVVEKGDDGGKTAFTIDVSGESINRTTIGEWQPGTRVNLEPALKMGDELGGHMVSGHVDGVGRVVAARPAGESITLEIEAPDELAPFIAPKGSVTVDGVSLTVNAVKGRVFGLNIIPHTRSATTLEKLAAGGKVNVEIDMLARYVARLLEYRD